MKRFILVTIAVLALSASAQAQNTAYVGVRSDDGAKGSVGVSVKIAGAVQLFSYTDIGEHGSVSTEALAIGSIPNSDFYVGLVAGPNVDFGQEGGSPLTYLTGSSGVLVGYKGKSKFGAVAWGKYKFAFENGTAYQDGYNWGGGLTYAF